MSSLYALLVGINQYHPDTHISPLSGCENDVKRFEKYLNPDSQIKTLTGAEATRENVIAQFTAHLAGTHVKAGDTVLFYFSGHGSYAKSNPAFKDFDSAGLDETLVLYDSRCEGGYDLADKELALLLHKIPAGANIVCIIDSCHSGSISRSVDVIDALTLGKAKQTPGDDKVRELSEYLHLDDTLNYEKMAAEGRLEIPATRHIVLSACDRGEVAYESAQAPTGVFSDALLTALETGGTDVSYSSLFEYVYALLQRRSKQQTPQLRVYEGYNPDLTFLGDKVQDGNPVFSVQRKDGIWVMNAGAFHGVKAGANVNVYYDEDKVLTVPIVSVGLDVSEVKELQLPAALYKASISNIKPVVNILVEGDVNRWMDKYHSEKIAFFTSPDIAFDYKLILADNSIKLFRADGTLVHGVNTITDESMAYMYDCCKQVCQWHLLVQLDNPGIKLDVDFAVDVMMQETWKEMTGSSTLCMEDNQQLKRKISVKNNCNTPYYAAVYSISSDYGILRRTADVDASVLVKDEVLPGLDKQTWLNIPEGRQELTLRFKLIVSKYPFKDFFIKEYSDLEPAVVDLQDAKGLRGIIGEMEDSFIQDWYAETITIRLVRSNGKINATQSFGAGKISIDAHPALSAIVNIGSVTASAKSIHPATALQEILQANGYEVMNLNDASKADVAPANIINLSAIENEDALSKQPLVIRLEDSDEGEVFAVTMEDGIIVPLGVATGNQDGKTIEISALPDNNTESSKNLLRAAWFCLVKVVLRKNLSKLRQVTYKNGEIKYIDNVVVGATDRVLLLVHGIIGDTKGQAACMEFLFQEKHYDLILAYDYENLNTRIEDIALDLVERLAKLEMNQKIDIVSHSMGGLVSRYMIEHIADAEGWVEKLYMFGTPNAGSALGKIPLWRNRVMGLLTLGCNVGKAFLGTLGPVLEAVNKGLAATVPVTNTLAQMDEDSDFYKLLNGAPDNNVTTEYYVIAGNLLEYQPDDPAWFGRLIEKIEMQAGKWINKGVANDIAVTVESIETVASVSKKVVGCHHLNYFEASSSVNYFKSLQAVTLND